MDQPESQWVVTIDGDRIAVADPKGERREIGRADLRAVAIETNDSGPWGSDFWWLMIGPDMKLACAYPQGAAGESEAMDWLFALPGFDHEAMIRASASTGNAFFELWRAPPAG
jgi:hypothetical protein